MLPVLALASEIFEIAGEGTELGCHSLTHRPMTEMNYSDLLRDTRQARQILEFGSETSITHFAYPYGAENKIFTGSKITGHSD